MKKIILDRGAGKTTELIKLANNCNGYIVCYNRDEAKNVFGLARKMGFDINFPITHKTLLDKQYCPRGVKKIWIDDLEGLLNVIIGVKRIEIGAITMDKEGLMTERKPFNIKPMNSVDLLKAFEDARLSLDCSPPATETKDFKLLKAQINSMTDEDMDSFLKSLSIGPSIKTMTDEDMDSFLKSLSIGPSIKSISNLYSGFNCNGIRIFKNEDGLWDMDL